MGRLHLLLLLLLLILLPTTALSDDYTTLVYRGCSKQPLSDPTGAAAQSISSLYSTLTQQSSKSRFYKFTSSSLSGLFQCRGDLSAAACFSCVSKIPPLADQLCSGKVTAARVQLQGCYLLYELAGFTQISGLQTLFKICSRGDASGSSESFQMKRDTAFTLMVNGVATSGPAGFFATTYQRVYAMGQCEGDLSSADCAQCVKAAVQRSQVECGSSVAGQVYLNKCFISYSYYGAGVGDGGGGGGGGGGSSISASDSSSPGQSTGKTVAIILGGTAGVGFLIICVLFARGLKKRDDDY